jgi:NTP pyrophosphatase (non-canonical NTP hydrolase)|tara:strand:- start:1390 stop:1695 length:306 start_codon:yes stop_codon:yes gene_type:complete
MKVINDIIDWAEIRGLLYGRDIQPEKQMLKLVEEVGETARALAYDDTPGLKDGIGDCAVCLIVLAEQKGLTFEECMEAAYKEISQRTGKLEDGLWKKQEDL